MQITVDTKDIKKLTKKLNNIQKKQIPFATALALTNTAKYTAIEVGIDTNKYLDRPRPTTVKGFRFIKADKRNLTATVLTKNYAEFLKWVVFGGTEKPKGRSHVIPYMDYSRNKYGNIPRGRVKRTLAQQNTFSAVIGGMPGIWQRQKSGQLKLLYAYEQVTRYKPIFPFEKRVAYHVNYQFLKEFSVSLSRALATAR